MSWNDGYFIDLDYPYLYHYLISPINIETCLLFNGQLWNRKEKYRYLELGFGHGISFNVHAAVSEGEFSGVDFNPGLVVSATAAARASGVDAKIYNESFKEFSQRNDLPEFDIIVMHGIWTWISRENQQIVVDFVRRKLAIGGVFYVSYNTPSCKWVRATPLRDLMKLYYDRATTQSDTAETRIRQSINFMSNAAAINSELLQKNPQLAQEIEFIKNTRLSYVAAEYFCNEWPLFSFSKMSEILSEAKLTFAAHAVLLKNIDSIFLDKKSKEVVSAIDDPLLKEEVRDLLTNHDFRCDIWVKGPRLLDVTERYEKLSKLRFILPKPPHEFELTINIPAGQIELPQAIYLPLMECLAEANYRPKSARELAAHSALQHHNEKQITDALIILAALHYVYIAQSDEVIEKVKARTDALNLFILEQAVHDDSMPYLVSPVIGGTVELSRIQKLFLLARAEGALSTDEWAMLAWQLLSGEKQMGVADNEELNTIKERAHNFAEKRLPFLKALGIVS